MAQFARPDSDITVSDWTPTPLWDNIDDIAANDSNFISSNNSTNNFCEVGLSNVTDPQSSSGHIVRYRYRKNAAAGNARNINVELLQGATVIRGNVHSSITEVFTAGTFTLTTTEADAITDYTDLRFRFTPGGTTGGSTGNRRTVDVSWAELETPDPPAPQNLTDTRTDTLGVADSYVAARGFGRSSTDSVAIADGYVAQQGTAQTQIRTDSEAIADSYSTARGTNRSATDTEALADSYVAARTISRTVTDTLGLADSYDAQVGAEPSVDVELIWTWDNPHLPITGTQDMAIFVRKSAAVAGNPTVVVNLREAGVFVAEVVPATSVTTTTGQWLLFSWDASLLPSWNGTFASGDSVETQILGSGVTGATVEVAGEGDPLQAPYWDALLYISSEAGVSLSYTAQSTLAIADSIVRRTVRRSFATDTLVLADSYSKRTQRAITDALALADSYTKSSGYKRAMTDALALGDSYSIAGALLIQRSVTDALSFADSYSASKHQFRTVTDSVSVADSYLRVTRLIKQVTDALQLADNLASRRLGRSATDPLAILDNVIPVSTTRRVVSDEITITDSYVIRGLWTGTPLMAIEIEMKPRVSASPGGIEIVAIRAAVEIVEKPGVDPSGGAVVVEKPAVKPGEAQIAEKPNLEVEIAEKPIVTINR